MSKHYRLHRAQLHSRLQQVRNQLRTLEQQLSHIDAQLQWLEPETTGSAAAIMKRTQPPASMTLPHQQPGFPLPIAAG